MDTILVLVHSEADGSLARPAREAIALAQSLGSPFTVGVVGEKSATVAGVAKVLAVEGAAFAVPRYSTDAAAAEALVKAANATLILAAGTSRWLRALPGVAQRVNGCVDTHVVQLSPSGEAGRWYYRQRMEARFTRSARPWFVVIDPGSITAAELAGDGPAVELVPVELTAALTRTAVTGYRSPQAGAQTIRPDADLLFVTGAGWTKKQKDGATHLDDAAKLILGFLDATKASLGSSKSLVDLSGEGQAVLPFLTHLNQVGQTGSTPRHPKGLATCCHGEEPHVVGWRFIRERRAVNLDANCGWARGKADVLYVADAFEVMAKLTAKLGGAS